MRQKVINIYSFYELSDRSKRKRFTISKRKFNTTFGGMKQ